MEQQNPPSVSGNRSRFPGKSIALEHLLLSRCCMEENSTHKNTRRYYKLKSLLRFIKRKWEDREAHWGRWPSFSLGFICHQEIWKDPYTGNSVKNVWLLGIYTGLFKTLPGCWARSWKSGEYTCHVWLWKRYALTKFLLIPGLITSHIK